MKVLAVILSVLLVTEAGLYASEEKLSVDLQHIRQIPTIVADLNKAKPPRVLFLGNSLTRTGIDPAVIAEGVPVKVAMVVPDDTTITDWYYTYRLFIEPGPAPDLVVVCFAYQHLQDGRPVNPERLGGQLGGFRLIREAFATDVTTLSDRIRYVLSASFRTWAYRERIQSRALAVIPGYPVLARLMNQSVRMGERQATADDHATYRQLSRFLNMTAKDGAKVVFVAMPMPEATPYEVSDSLKDVIKEGGGSLIDMRSFEAKPEDFPDGYHLAPAAAPRFSAALASNIWRRKYIQHD